MTIMSLTDINLYDEYPKSLNNYGKYRVLLKKQHIYALCIKCFRIFASN